MLDFEKNLHVIEKDSDIYPKQLLELKDAPQVLYVLGNIKLLSSISVSIVGTRQSSELGNSIAFDFASKLSENEITIVSGLADGIDESAHKGAITRTISVVAGGFNQVLRGRKYRLAEEIIKNNGAIVSEYPLDMPCLNHMFLERNRIISGLSKCCIVIEAPFKSGAINTANHCLEQGRQLFAVPWNLKYSKGEGTNNLLFLGAIPVINYKQILFYLFPSNKQLTIEDIYDDKVFNSSKKIVIPDEYMGYYEFISENSPVSADDIIAFFNKKNVAEITADLSMMEVEGYVQIKDSKYYI